jgi:hypothetical protein
MRAAALALLMLAWSDGLAAADALASIEVELVRAPIVRASFRQERTMRVLKRPLATRGQLTAVAGQGVLWRVLEPYEATVLVTAAAARDGGAPGAARARRRAAGPADRRSPRARRAVRADTAAPPAAQGWRIVLTPKEEALAAFIAEVEVLGGRFVEQAMISEAGGDRTTIAFADFRTEPGTLDADERAYFEQR